MCDACSLHALLMVVLQPLAFFPLSIPTYHKPQTQLMEKLGLLWTLIFPFLGETVQLFVSDSPHPPFISSAHPSEQCCMIFLRTGFDRRHCPNGQGSQPLPASQVCDWHCCKAPAGSELGAGTAFACSSPHVTGSLISQVTVAPVRSEFLSSALLLSCLQSPVFHYCHSARLLTPLICCFFPPWKPISQQQGQHLLIWKYHISHRTVFPHQSSITPSSLWQQLYPIPLGWQQDLEFPVATEDATWSL